MPFSNTIEVEMIGDYQKQLLWTHIMDSLRSVLVKLPNWGAIWEKMSPALQLYGELKKLFSFRSNTNEDLFEYQQR